MFSAFKKSSTKSNERGYFEKLASGLLMLMLTVSVASVLVSASLFIWLFQAQIEALFASWYAFAFVSIAALLGFVGFIDINRRWAKALETSSENAAAVLYSMKAKEAKAAAPQIIVVPSGQAQNAFNTPVLTDASPPRLPVGHALPSKSAKKSAFVF